MTIRVEATPYGRPALDRLRDVVADRKRADPLTPVTILVPSNLAGLTVRRHLAHGLAPGAPGVAAIDVTTTARLAERLATRELGTRRPATRTITAAAWRQALATDPGVFAEVAEHPATVRGLTASSTELRDLDPSSLDTLAAANQVTADVVRLHRQVTGRLERDWYDRTGLLRAAADRLRRNGSATSPDVVLYLPQDLSLAESDLLRALAGSSTLTVVAGLTGVRRADEAVHRSLRRIGVEATLSPSIPTATRVLNASDSDDEVRCVVREVVHALASTPAHRIAVLYSSTHPYARLLHEHLGAAGVTVNGPGSSAVVDRAVSRTLLELLALVDQDVPRADLFRALAGAPTHDLAGSRIPISRWERISRLAGVVRGDDWHDRLTRFLDDELERAGAEDALGERPWLADKHRRTAQDATMLRDFATGLREQLQDAAAMTTWRSLSTWCLRLFTTVVGEGEALLRLPPGEQHAAAAITALLTGLAGLDEVTSHASLRTLRDVLELELSAALPRVGTFGHGVYVGPLATAVGLDLDVVLVVGLSEDLYPGRLPADALLPERARALLPDALRSSRDALNAKHRDVLAAFAAADHAVACFPRGNLRGSGSRLPSRWLLSSLRELAGDKRLPATEWESADYRGQVVTAGSYAGELLTTDRLATEQEWRVRQARTGHLDDPAVVAAQAMIRARAGDAFTRFDGDLREVDGLPRYATDDALISPTALESYATCPHAFYVGRILRVEPLDQPEDVVSISAADIGTFMHQCMDELVQTFHDQLPGPGEPWSAEQRDRLAAIAAAKADEFAARGLTGHPRLWQGERDRIAADLQAMLDTDDAWRARVGAGVRASELAFGMRGFPPVEVPIASGRVRIRGSADKVDVGADGRIFVTDIKTGRPRSFSGITPEDPVAGGTKLQLPAYAYAARERFGDASTPVTTGYWFVRRDPRRIELELTESLVDTYARTLDVIVGSIAAGLFPLKAPEAPDFAYVQCWYCNPDGIGHAENRRRWERKRHDPALRELVQLVEPAALAAAEEPA